MQAAPRERSPRRRRNHRGRRSTRAAAARAPQWASDLVSTLRVLPLPDVRRAIEALRWVIERLDQIVRELEAETEYVQV